MKKIVNFIFLITIISISLTNCIKSKTENRDGLTALVMQSMINGTANDAYTKGSLVVIERIDLVNQSFKGECYDTFTSKGGVVSPSVYYNTVPGGSGGRINTDLKKYALSTSNCAALSFTGTTNTNLGSSTQRPDSSESGFNFKMYTCDPNNNPCQKTAIAAAGF